MISRLGVDDLWNLIENGSKEPHDEERDASTLCITYQSMDERIIPKIIVGTTTKEAWNILQMTFGDCKTHNIMYQAKSIIVNCEIFVGTSMS